MHRNGGHSHTSVHEHINTFICLQTSTRSIHTPADICQVSMTLYTCAHSVTSMRRCMQHSCTYYNITQKANTCTHTLTHYTQSQTQSLSLLLSLSLSVHSPFHNQISMSTMTSKTETHINKLFIHVFWHKSKYYKTPPSIRSKYRTIGVVGKQSKIPIKKEKKVDDSSQEDGQWRWP